MKIRQGFVSNSSSSSFVCHMCGQKESGWDACPRDFGWLTCVYGHVICNTCMIGEPPEPPDEEDEEAYEKWEEETECGYYCPESYCPVCQFIEPSQVDMKYYLQKLYKVPEEDVMAEIKKTNRRRRKIYDFEYIAYVAQKHNVDVIKLIGELKDKFGTYKDFLEYLRGGR